MKKEDLNFTRIFFTLVSLIILALGILLPDSNTNMAIISSLIIIALVYLDIKVPSIANISKDNPKVKTMRFINKLTISIIILTTLSALLFPIRANFSQKTNEILMLGIVSLFIMVFGNLAPKLPFNRYMGLRLPWTIRDADTWKIAHRVLGYVSFPLALLQFILGFYFSIDKVIPFTIITWILIPGLYSLWFYYKKFKNI